MMTADQYTELIDFLAKKFGRIDERFDAVERRLDRVEGRLTKVEVRLEKLQDDVRILAEGLSMTNERLDRYHQDHQVRIRALEQHWFQA
jgi:chromosome segregation ATPase